MATRCICRLDGKKTLGWQVRVGPKRGYHSKLFSDSLHGGKDKALAAAKEYLDDFVKRHPEVAGEHEPNWPSTVPYWNGALMADNKSGRTGVYRSHEYLDSGNVSEYWGASYPIGPNGKHGSRIFRVNVFGNQHAKDLAVAYRQAWEKAYQADELDRLFAQSDYPVIFTYPSRYYHRPDLADLRKVHIFRRDDLFWCGKELNDFPWTELIEPPDAEDVCQGCQSIVASYERLINSLLYYQQGESDWLHMWNEKNGNQMEAGHRSLA